MHIFIDESGHFQYKDGDGVFVLAAVKTADPRALRKLIRRTRHAKLAKKEKEYSEIKAAFASDKYKRYLLAKLAETDTEVFVVALRMRDVPHGARKSLEGVVYLKLVRALLYAAGVKEAPRVIVRMDKRSLPGISFEAFRFALTQEFVGLLAQPRFFHADFMESHEEPGIQIADFVAHAIYLKYSRRNTNWYDMLSPIMRSEQDGSVILKIE